MVRVAAGRHWRGAAPAKRQHLLQAFRRMTAATYASRFHSFDGEAFELVGARDGPRETRLVSARIVKGDGAAVPFTYVMVRGADGWRIADILLDESVSELAVRRSEYRAILAKGGIDALASSLRRKADQLLSP